MLEALCLAALVPFGFMTVCTVVYFITLVFGDE